VGELSVAIDNEVSGIGGICQIAAAPERTAQKTGTDPNVLQHK
jgi:hypothetical protein